MEHKDDLYDIFPYYNLRHGFRSQREHIDTLRIGGSLFISEKNLSPAAGMRKVLHENGLKCRKDEFFAAAGIQGREVRSYRNGKEYALSYRGNHEYEIFRIR